MREKYQNALMWALYAVLFLLAAVIQTVIFGHPRFLSVKMAVLPVAVACVAMHNGAENGALFGLFCGLFWCFAGADGGALHIPTLCLAGAFTGYLCDRLLSRNIVSAILMSLLALLLCQSVLFFFKLWLGAAHGRDVLLLLRQMFVSLMACPPCYLAAWAIRKAGA